MGLWMSGEGVLCVDKASVHVWSAPWSPLRLWKSPLSSAHAFSGEWAVTSVSLLCHVALKSCSLQPAGLTHSLCQRAWAPPEGGAADLCASQGPSAAGPSCYSNNFRDGKKKKQLPSGQNFSSLYLAHWGICQELVLQFYSAIPELYQHRENGMSHSLMFF